MTISRSVRPMIDRSAQILRLLTLSGCAILAPAPPEPVVIAAPEPEPVIEPEPEPVVEPEPEVIPPPPVRPPPVVEVESQNIEPLVAVVITDRNPAYVNVANALEEFLDHHEIYDLSDRSISAESAFAAIAESGAEAVVAVGLPAAQAASRYSSVPVVVGQVFNISAANLLSDNVRAVGVLPPIELQLDAWQKIDPSLANVGAILGPGHEDLIAEAERALSEQGIKFHYAIAATDRETLYLFNRLVRDIDGFLLFPDNRVLSRSVLVEMMEYATRHRVQVAVYNESFQDFGAVFNAASIPADIATTIVGVLDKVLDGDIDQVPPVTALSGINVQTNQRVLEKLGLSSAEADSIDTNTEIDNTIAGTQ